MEIKSVSEAAGDWPDLKNARRVRQGASDAIKLDRLPPHEGKAEMAIIGCLLLAPGDCMKECVERIKTPEFFYDLRHQKIWDCLLWKWKRREVIDVIAVQSWLRDKKLLKEIGGIAYLSECQEAVPSTANLSYWLELCAEKFARRKIIAVATDAVDRGYDSEITTDDLTLGIRADMETVSILGSKPHDKLIDVVSPEEARSFEPDPEDFLIGEGMIMRGHIVTIGGAPGVGKSRLATSLAVAGARGTNRWQGYPVRSQWRTLILQTENRGRRLKEECDAIPKDFDDWIRISRTLPQGLNFGSAEFRRELLAIHESWPFQMLILDPLNDIVSEDGQADYKEAMANINRSFAGRPMPAIIVVAHLRKPRAENGQRRKSGRELLHEISGTLAIGSTARTVFIVQAASNSMSDDRIIFEVAKANDCKPEWLSEYGTRTAWYRRDGEFPPCDDFDWEAWDNPGSEERRAVTEEMLIEILKGEKDGIKMNKIADMIAARFDIGKSTAARAISEGGYLRCKIKPTAKGGFVLK